MAAGDLDERVDLSNHPETLLYDLYDQVFPKAFFRRPIVPIKQLLLRRNELVTLEAYGKAFSAIRHYLLELSLKENHLTRVPSEIFSLTLLTSLSLASNHITSIQENVLSRFKHLQWLSLSCNELASLPNDLADCRKLKGLDLHSNCLEDIPLAVQRLDNLQVLLIQKNQVQSIPLDFVFPNRLHTLNLSFNELDRFPHGLVHHPPESLTHLYLSGNPLRQIPPGFLRVGYKHLVSLDLHTCHLAHIGPEFFMRLAERKLRRLNLAINVLEDLPPEIGLLTQVEWLNLNDNRLKGLPETLSNLTRLVKLGLVQNRLEGLPARMFSRMYRLQKLDIRRNHLEYLPASILMLSPLEDAISQSKVAVPMAAFRMHPCPPTCPVQMQTEADQGGGLRTLLLGENPRLVPVDGIIHEDVSLPRPLDASEPLRQSRNQHAEATNENNDDNDGALESLDDEHPVGRREFDGFSCRDANVVAPLTLRETAIRVLLNRGYGKLRRLPSTKEPLRSICLEHFPDHYHAQLDLYPEYTRTYLEAAVPDCISPALRAHIVRSARQCDKCSQWYSEGKLQIAYTTRLGMQQTPVPIRFDLCSFHCAHNGMAQLQNSTETWDTLRQDQTLRSIATQAGGHDTDGQRQYDEGTSSSNMFIQTCRQVGRFALSVLNFVAGNQYHPHLQSDISDIEPPALFPSARQLRNQHHDRATTLTSATPAAIAFNHLPRDAIRLERF